MGTPVSGQKYSSTPLTSPTGDRQSPSPVLRIQISLVEIKGGERSGREVFSFVSGVRPDPGTSPSILWSRLTPQEWGDDKLDRSKSLGPRDETEYTSRPKDPTPTS